MGEARGRGVRAQADPGSTADPGRWPGRAEDPADRGAVRGLLALPAQRGPWAPAQAGGPPAPLRRCRSRPRHDHSVGTVNPTQSAERLSEELLAHWRLGARGFLFYHAPLGPYRGIPLDLETLTMIAQEVRPTVERAITEAVPAGLTTESENRTRSWA